MAEHQHSRLWRALLAALILSVSLHAGAVLWAVWTGPEEQVLEAGGAETSVATLGNAFADMLVAGANMPDAQAQPVEPEEMLEPQEVETAEVVEPTPTEVVEQKPYEVVAQAPTVTPVEQVITPSLVSPVMNESVQGNFVEAESSLDAPLETEITKPEEVAEQPEIVKPVEQVEVQEAKPVETPTEELKPEEPKKAEEVEPEKPVEVAEVIPVPQTRPKPLVHDKPKKQVKKKKVTKKEPTKKKATKKSASSKGAGGKSNTIAQKGGAKAKGKNSQAGNAAASNYAGKVRRKISRARRSSRGNARGTAVVSFVVDQSGRLSSARISRSSGNASVDKAALDTVRRAAPFPRFPGEVTQRSMRLAIPLQFK